MVDYARLFEEELNKKLATEKKLKSKNLKVRVVFIPLRRDQLLPGLAAGKGDIAAGNLPITPERQKLVDFSAAGLSNVSEVVVAEPGILRHVRVGRVPPRCVGPAGEIHRDQWRPESVQNLLVNRSTMWALLRREPLPRLVAWAEADRSSFLKRRASYLIYR